MIFRLQKLLNNDDFLFGFVAGRRPRFQGPKNEVSTYLNKLIGSKTGADLKGFPSWETHTHTHTNTHTPTHTHTPLHKHTPID